MKQRKGKPSVIDAPACETARRTGAPHRIHQPTWIIDQAPSRIRAQRANQLGRVEGTERPPTCDGVADQHINLGEYQLADRDASRRQAFDELLGRTVFLVTRLE